MAPPTTKVGTTKTKATNGAGVKKATGPKAGKKANARNAMAKMQAYCELLLHVLPKNDALNRFQRVRVAS